MEEGRSVTKLFYQRYPQLLIYISNGDVGAEFDKGSRMLSAHPLRPAGDDSDFAHKRQHRTNTLRW